MLARWGGWLHIRARNFSGWIEVSHQSWHFLKEWPIRKVLSVCYSVRKNENATNQDAVRKTTFGTKKAQKMQRKKSRRIKFTKPIGKERFGRQRAQDSIKKAEKKGNTKRKLKISNSEKHAGCRRGLSSIEEGGKKANSKNTQKRENERPRRKKSTTQIDKEVAKPALPEPLLCACLTFA